jgi:hypothetical protein
VDDRLTAAERSALWDHAAKAVGEATAQIRGLGGADPADAVWAVGDTLHAAAAVLGSRVLRGAGFPESLDLGSAEGTAAPVPPLGPASSAGPGHRSRQH